MRDQCDSEVLVRLLLGPIWMDTVVYIVGVDYTTPDYGYK